MIVQLVHDAHRYTHQLLEGSKQFQWRTRSYSWALRRRRLPRTTYIFSDLDRLGFWELELAGRLRRVLHQAGLRTLNDPARVLQRYHMLRCLKRNGFNRFDVWNVQENVKPPRFPVFLRTRSAHRGVLSELLRNQAEVGRAIAAALEQGIPGKELMLVEYCAEPINAVYRKLAIFRIGEQMVATICAHESRWVAKYGELGIAGQALYDDEYNLIRTNRYADALRPAFELANIEYGRADFGLVSGSPQVYEINTNPHVARTGQHPFPIRMESERLFLDNLYGAIAAIDTPASRNSVHVDAKLLRRQRRKDRWLLGSRWVC